MFTPAACVVATILFAVGVGDLNCGLLWKDQSAGISEAQFLLLTVQQSKIFHTCGLRYGGTAG